MQPIHLYNSLVRQKELFTPMDENHVTFYVCGPTVYGPPHIGNARPAVVFDVLWRLLQKKYKRVTYMRNITDIDDKIIDAAKKNNEPIGDLTKRVEKIYWDAVGALFVGKPTHQPRATEYIDTMIAMIQRLIENGHAYEAEGHVLFSVESFDDYGELSKQSREGILAGARVEVAPYKKDAADFVLWKPSLDEHPGWESPWGRGRPGWHIECSAMIKALAGETIDIHGGGQDLQFPHHENEIAQSKCAHDGAPLARYWMHNGMLRIDGDKMSKSLGNILTVDALLEKHDGEVLRYALLSTHYRQNLDLNEALLQQSKDALTRFYTALDKVKNLEANHDAIDEEKLFAPLCDDLNTPGAFALLHENITALNAAADDAEKAKLKANILALGSVLGILTRDPEAFLQGESGDISAAEIEALIAKRSEARANKDFAASDAIRDDLLKKGIALDDSAEGTSWRKI